MSGANFVGTWNLEKSEKFEEFLSAIGVNLVKRKMMASASPSMEVRCDGNKMTFKLSGKDNSLETTFTPGEQVEQEQPSGDVMICSPAWEGEKLVIEMKPKNASSKAKARKVTRCIEGDRLVQTMQVGDVVAKRIFKKN